MSKLSPPNYYPSKLSALPTQQQGVALIVVLMVLIMIMLVGAIAVRQSNQDLKVATTDQINTLLLQGADGANAKLEGLLNGDPAAPAYQAAISGNGIFGHFMVNGPDAANDELIYCYNPRAQQYLTKQATIRRNGGVLENRTVGYCDPDSGSSYISARQTILTQMSITPVNTTGQAPYTHMTEGRSVDNSAIKKYQFDTRATAALPAYNDPGTCFQNSSVTGSSMTVVRCLQGYRDATSSTTQTNDAVPSKQIYQQVDVDYQSDATKCTPFGKGTGTYLSTKCTLATPPAPTPAPATTPSPAPATTS